MLLMSQWWWMVLFFNVNIINWHGIYLSVVEISPSKEQKQINLKLKIFPDDLDNVLRLFDKNLYISTDICQKEKSILAYFSKNLAIKINHKSVRLQWSGCKKIGDSLELSFYISQQESFEMIDIKATFFTELFPSQQNIIQFKSPGRTSLFLKFKAGDTWQSVSFPVK
jgi:hypothetical protein